MAHCVVYNKIKQCKTIPRLYKTIALSYIDSIERGLELMPWGPGPSGIYHPLRTRVVSVFVWSDTPQGHDFWNAIDTYGKGEI